MESMKTSSLQYRYYMFICISFILISVYQSYHSYRIDVTIEEALNESNKHTQRYSEFMRELTLRNLELKHDLLHSQAMYDASTNHCKMLEEQINVISEYWKKEYMKISDELFDLKHSKKKQ